MTTSKLQVWGGVLTAILGVFCQFSPVMGPSVFAQSGPLPEVTLVKLLTKDEQTIVVCQSHDVDSIGTSFRDWGVP